MYLFVLFLRNIGDDQHHLWVNVQLEPEAGYLSIKTGKRPVNKNAIHKSHWNKSWISPAFFLLYAVLVLSYKLTIYLGIYYTGTTEESVFASNCRQERKKNVFVCVFPKLAYSQTKCDKIYSWICYILLTSHCHTVPHHCKCSSVLNLSCLLSFSFYLRWTMFQTFLLVLLVHLASRLNWRVMWRGTGLCVFPQPEKMFPRYQRDKVSSDISVCCRYVNK